MGKILEGRWDCSYCGTKGILGRHRECPNCGRPRGEDVKFYLPSSKDYVPDEETQKSVENQTGYVVIVDHIILILQKFVSLVVPKGVRTKKIILMFRNKKEH